MKKLILIFALLTTFMANAQLEVDYFEFQGNFTSTIRDAFDVPTGKVFWGWNITTDRFEFARADDVWKTMGDLLLEEYPNLDTDSTDDAGAADGSETIIQATSPITLSGTGTVGSPYQIGLNDAAYMLLDGSRAFTGNVDFGNNLITNVEELLGNPDNNAGIGDDAAGDGSTYFNHANIARLSIANGSGNFWNGNLAFGNHLAVYPTTTFLGAEGAIFYEFDASGSPTKDESLATKKYVDDQDSAEANTPYRESIAEGTTLSARSYDVGQYGRIDLNTSSSSAITVNFTNKTNAIGEPIALHIYTTNAGGTTFTFDAETFDNQDTGAFSVVLAQNEERTLHFVVAQATVVRCTNFPVGSGGGPDASLSEADQSISVADRTINLSGVSSVLNIDNGSGTDITRFTKTGLEISGIENIGTLTDPMSFGSPYQIYNNGTGGTTTVTNPLEGTVLWDGPTEEFRLYHDSAWLILNKIANYTLTPKQLKQAGVLDVADDGYVPTYDETNEEFIWVEPSSIGTGAQNLSLSGTGNGTLEISNGTNVDLTTVDGIDPNNIVSDVTGVTGADAITNIISLTQAEYNAITPDANTFYIITDASTAEIIQIACSDLSTDVTTGTSKAYFRMPWAATLTDVRVSLLTAGTTTGLTVDINESGTSVLSTKLTTDATEKTSETAATAAVISDSALANDAEMTIDFDAVPTGGQGVIVTLFVEY